MSRENERLITVTISFWYLENFFYVYKLAISMQQRLRSRVKCDTCVYVTTFEVVLTQVCRNEDLKNVSSIVEYPFIRVSRI